MMKVLRSPRWIAAHVVMLVIVVAFVSLGLWQLRRLDERRSYNVRLLSRAAEPLVPVEDLIAAAGSADPSVAYRRATASGRYDLQQERIMLSQSFRGISGHHVVTPLVLDDGRAILVNRGWVPIDAHTPPVEAAEPPEGTVRVVGVLLPSQGRRRLGPPDAPQDRTDQMFRIDIPRLQELVPYRLYPLWLNLQTQDPPQASTLPRRVDLPPLDEGSHFSYAIQWFAFTIIALAWYGVLVRNALLGRSARAASFAHETDD